MSEKDFSVEKELALTQEAETKPAEKIVIEEIPENQYPIKQEFNLTEIINAAREHGKIALVTKENGGGEFCVEILSCQNIEGVIKYSIEKVLENVSTAKINKWIKENVAKNKNGKKYLVRLPQIPEITEVKKESQLENINPEVLVSEKPIDQIPNQPEKIEESNQLIIEGIVQTDSTSADEKIEDASQTTIEDSEKVPTIDTIVKNENNKIDSKKKPGLSPEFEHRAILVKLIKEALGKNYKLSIEEIKDLAKQNPLINDWLQRSQEVDLSSSNIELITLGKENRPLMFDIPIEYFPANVYGDGDNPKCRLTSVKLNKNGNELVLHYERISTQPQDSSPKTIEKVYEKTWDQRQNIDLFQKLISKKREEIKKNNIKINSNEINIDDLSNTDIKYFAKKDKDFAKLLEDIGTGIATKNFSETDDSGNIYLNRSEKIKPGSMLYLNSISLKQRKNGSNYFIFKYKPISEKPVETIQDEPTNIADIQSAQETKAVEEESMPEPEILNIPGEVQPQVPLITEEEIEKMVAGRVEKIHEGMIEKLKIEQDAEKERNLQDRHDYEEKAQELIKNLESEKDQIRGLKEQFEKEREEFELEKARIHQMDEKQVRQLIESQKTAAPQPTYYQPEIKPEAFQDLQEVIQSFQNLEEVVGR